MLYTEHLFKCMCFLSGDSDSDGVSAESDSGIQHRPCATCHSPNVGADGATPREQPQVSLLDSTT